ncbi:TATA-binding protein-associated factor 2N [Carex littledalei]|uniref:TATA-binding protein-associated factor 2N n=1 Tax=Carex littledalei TaxID=544730 RepID=A0A833RDZ5_9POAL|nr:TATA-binding protein-associated factor 2N [Carex littledalei]
MRPRERDTTDDDTPTPPPPSLAALTADQPPPLPPSQVSPTNGAGPSSMAARDSEPAADPKEPLSTTTTNSPNRLMSEPLSPDGRRSGSLPSDRRPVSPPAGSRRSPDFRRRGSSPPRELNRRRSRSPFLTEFNRRRRRSPPLTEFGRRGHNSSPLTESALHGNHGFRELRRTPPHRGTPLEGFRCRGSPPRMTEFRRRGSPPLAEVRRRGSPPLAEFRRHRSPLMVDAHPYGRGCGDRGYPMHAGPISPPHRHRSDEARFDMEFDGPAGPSRHGHGFRGGRADGRLRDRDSLLLNGREKGAGGRGQGQSSRGPTPHYELRNDPNLSPREGDWICQNASCGNLNFARRTHCNICNKHRHANELQNRSLSPRRGYFPSPPPHHRSPPVRMPGPPPERVLHREPVRYNRSPPPDWALDAGPFNPRGERLVRADLLECRESSGFGWQGNEEFTRRERGVRDGFLLETRRGRRSVSPLRGRFARDLRERSRSPIGDRKFKFVGTSRGNRDFGAGYKRSRGDSFRGRSRGDGRVVSRGRNGNAY